MLLLITLALFAVSVTAEDIIGVNLALEKQTAQSSTYEELVAGQAVDGKDALLKNVLKDCAVTTEQHSPWWLVRLGDVFPVSKIKIYGNPDNAESLIDAVVSVLDVDRERKSIIRRTVVGQVSSQYYEENAIVITIAKPVYGNVVAVRLFKTGQLTLCGVEVYADLPLCKKTQDNIAIGKETFQSSTRWKRNSSNAVDADSSGNLKLGSEICTRTKSENTPWWSVDLGEIHRISKIQIFNRKDCCAERLIGAVVRIIDVNTDEELTIESARRVHEIGKVTELNYQEEPIVFELPTPVSGNLVAVSLDGKTDVLTLCEIEIFVDCKKRSFWKYWKKY